MTITLAELNASLETGKYGNTRQWDRYTLRTEYAVGRAGSRSLRGTTGKYTHVIWQERVIAEQGAHKPGTYGVGQVFSSRGICINRSGQNTAQALNGVDTDKVTCPSCQKFLTRIAARLATEAAAR